MLPHRRGVALLVAIAACGDPSAVFEQAAAPSCAVAAAPATCEGEPPVEVCPDEIIDVQSLLGEMVDLGRLARRPCVPFTSHKATSYDRASVSPVASSDEPVGWYANHDWSNYLRLDGDERVMLDVDGPGALVHLWTATEHAGTVRIYLDDAETPVLAADFAALLSGQVAPFGEPFSARNASGGNLDFPIPYRRHVKVTVDADDFYQVTYRTYPAGTDVTTFSMVEVAGLDALAQALDGDAPADQDDDETATCSGSELAVDADPGGSELTELTVFPARGDPAALRGTVLSLTFDGRETTRVPLGDFFGAGPGFHPHRMFPVEVTADGRFTARFVMPFRCQAIVRVEGVPALLRVRHRAAAFTDRSLHFAAHWMARGPVPTRPFRDLTIAKVAGAGAYVGTLLTVDSRVPMWWGEGDEKISIDDDAFPSWFGTGTEDYFGYANSKNSAFQHPYRMLANTGSLFGQVSNARFHVLDDIPFTTSLRFDLELWHWDPAATLFYDTIAYMYLAPTAQDLLPPPAPTDFRLP